jgi:hypothetical protein
MSGSGKRRFHFLFRRQKSASSEDTVTRLTTNTEFRIQRIVERLQEEGHPEFPFLSPSDSVTVHRTRKDSAEVQTFVEPMGPMETVPMSQSVSTEPPAHERHERLKPFQPKFFVPRPRPGAEAPKKRRSKR